MVNHSLKPALLSSSLCSFYIPGGHSMKVLGCDEYRMKDVIRSKSEPEVLDQLGDQGHATILFL